LLQARNGNLVLNNGNARILATLHAACTSTRVTVLGGDIIAPSWITTPLPAEGCPADALTPEQRQYMVADGRLPCNPSALTLRGTYARLTLSHTQSLNAGEQYYAVAGFAPAGWFQNNSTGWALLDDPFLPLATASGTGPLTLTLVDALDISGIPGTELYIGYGANADEMMMSGRYCGLFRVAP